MNNMKQHITSEQLNELFEHQQILLYRILENNETAKRIPCFWDITIGKMIEFLQSFGVGNIYQGISHCSDDIIWAVEIGYDENGNETNIGGHYESNELCDALWEAVKEIMQNEIL